MTSINFKVIDLTPPGSGLEPAIFGFPNLLEWEVGALLIQPPHLYIVACTYRGHWPGWRAGHRQPDKKGAHTVGHTGALPTVHTERTDNQSDKGHKVGHCQLYIQRTQTTSMQEHTVGHTGAINCTYRGHTQPDMEYSVGHTGTVNCTFRRQRQPVTI